MDYDQWQTIGQRIWRRSDCPKLSDRMNAYGAYDFTHGECFLWQNGWCNGEETVNFLRALVAQAAPLFRFGTVLK